MWRFQESSRRKCISELVNRETKLGVYSEVRVERGMGEISGGGCLHKVQMSEVRGSMRKHVLYVAMATTQARSKT